MAYKVKELADLAGVSVRTLHHYDAIGLLVPSDVTPAGHRLYKNADLERLQQIMFFRELDFPLPAIHEILGKPTFDRKRALQSHKELLEERRSRLERMIATVDLTIHSIEGGYDMSKEEMFGGFDLATIEEHKRKYASEAREHYGDGMVDAVDRRTDSYGKEDWARIMGESERNYVRIAERMDCGPDDALVQEAVADIRAWITNNFYDCTPEIFRGLGDLYGCG